MVFIGQAEPLKINLDEIQQRYNRADYAAVAQSLREIGVSSPQDLFSTFAGQRSNLGPWVAALRSPTISICAGNTSAGGASTPRWKIKSIAA